MACLMESINDIELRLKSMGFRVVVKDELPALDFGNPSFSPSYWGLIHCYCGKHEKFLVPKDALYEYDDQWNSPNEEEYIRRLLLHVEKHALNESHLREDGFTEEQICEIKAGKGAEKLATYCEMCGE